MDPIRRINRIICSALGFMLLSYVTPVLGEDLSDSVIAQQGMEAPEGAYPAPAPVPKSPDPVRLMLELPRHESLLSLNDVTCSTETDMFLILKHMMLEPLKFRSNYVDSHV